MRRLGVLVRGLPPEAATWRKDRLPPADEHTAVIAEQLGGWSRALLMALLGHRKVRTPALVQIARPGDERDRPRVERDPNRIAAFLGRVSKPHGR